MNILIGRDKQGGPWATKDEKGEILVGGNNQQRQKIAKKKFVPLLLMRILPCW